MKPELDAWIDKASRELRPVRWPGAVLPRLLLWWGASAAAVVLLSLWLGPWRSGAVAGLWAAPAFLAETLVGLGVGLIAAALGFRMAVPDLTRGHRRALGALSLVALWALVIALGWVWPALEPTMAGKREGCEWETLLLALPPLVLGVGLLRGLAPLERSLTGMTLGLAAGALPALTMQFACMYDPGHALTHHGLPIFGVAILGAVGVRLLLRRV